MITIPEYDGERCTDKILKELGLNHRCGKVYTMRSFGRILCYDFEEYGVAFNLFVVTGHDKSLIYSAGSHGVNLMVDTFGNFVKGDYKEIYGYDPDDFILHSMSDSDSGSYVSGSSHESAEFGAKSPEVSTWADLDFSELPGMMDLFEGTLSFGDNYEVATDEVKIEGMNLADIFKKPDEVEKRDFKPKFFPNFNIPAGTRSFKLHKYKPPIDSAQFTIYEDGSDLKILDVVIGTVKRRSGLSIKLNRIDSIKAADIYSEEVHGKGSGLGFSSFVHLAACLQLLEQGGLIEGHEGIDVILDLDVVTQVTGLHSKLTIEVTNNHEARHTNANWCIGKYELLYSTQIHTPRFIEYLDIAQKEERLDNTMFLGKNFDTPDTDYTPIFSKLHEDIRYMTDAQVDKITRCAKKWYTEMKPSEMPDLTDSTIMDDLSEMIKTVAVKHSDKPMLPCMFRALPRMHVDIDTTEKWHNTKVEIAWHEGDLRSTFHTINLGESLAPYAISKAKHVSFMVEIADMETMAYKHYMNGFKMIQSIELEADLYRRIDGNVGHYYSRESEVGITWLKKKSSLIWLCRFYTFQDPGDPKEVGNWSNKSGVHYSASFKLSQMEITHGIALPGKVFASWNALFNQSTVNERSRVCESLCLVAGCWKNSTWQTSVYASASRFKTTGHIGMMGNFCTLLRKSYTGMKRMRNCDYLYYCLDKNAVENPAHHDITPMFRLPIKFHCLEKDIAHGMQWHIRDSQHEINCCKKMIDACVNEISFRPIAIEWYEKQHSFLEKTLTKGSTYYDFKELMNSCPDIPVLNVVLFIALCNLSQESLITVSSTQTNTGFRVNNLVSDRGSSKVDNGVLISSKVANTLSDFVKETGAVGPYSLLLSSLDTSGEHTYGISAKDAKSSDREIATMEIRLRPSQYFKECMSSTVCMGMPEDAVLSTDKYGPMVREFKEVFKCQQAATSSEDRSFFSGNMHPEALALTTLIMAKITSSPSLVSASGLQRLDKTRKIVLTPEFKSEMLPEGTPHGTMVRLMQGKMQPCVYITLHYHIMQGIQQINTSAVNAIFNTGILKICEEALPNDVKKTYIITTHDDVGRAVGFDAKTDIDKATEFTMLRPLSILNHCMMKNNDKKLVLSNKKGITEVNNITVVSSGMVTQAPIFATLAVQALLGPGPLHDIMTAISQARNVLFWGAPPNVIWSAYLANKELVRDRWRFTRDEMTFLESVGFFPSNVSQLISGFYPRTKLAQFSMWDCTKDEFKPQIMDASRPLWLSMLNITSFGSDDIEITSTTETSLMTLNQKLKSVEMGRRIGGRLRANHVRLAKVSKLVAKKNKFLSLLKDGDPPNLDFLEPPKVRCILKPMTKYDRNPAVMGQSVGITLPDRKRIMAKRLFDVEYRQALTEDELHIASLPDKDFQESLRRLDLKDRYKGFQFTSPEGLPGVRYMDGVKYTKLQSFNFVIDVDKYEEHDTKFTFRGVEVKFFEVCLWGGSTPDTYLAFGTGMIDDSKLMFYQKKGSKMTAHRIEEPVGTTTCGVDKVSWLRGCDFSPVNYPLEIMPGPRLNISGDPLSMLNYGNFIKTRSGIDYYCKLFELHKSIFPYFLRLYLPEYPLFPDDCVELGDSKTYIMNGMYTTRFKLRNGMLPTALVDATKPETTIELLKRVKTERDIAVHSWS